MADGPDECSFLYVCAESNLQTKNIVTEATQFAPNIHFRPVFFARYQVRGLTPVQTDEMLANGWFRNDLYVFTTLGRYIENEWKPCLMLRICLEGFHWKKRLRKVLRQNGQRFTVKIGPFAPRPALENLWREYKSKVHHWTKVPNLAYHLFKGQHPSDFNTYEVGVYFEDKLVAFSVFDKGSVSLGSLEAAYDARFSKHSLGVYTMLLEIEYGISQNMDYYYPGFYPRNSPMFDYKLRPGGIEFFRHKKGEWTAWEQREPSDWLLDGVFRKLRLLQHELHGGPVSASLKAFNKLNYPSGNVKLSDYNFLLVLERQPESGPMEVYQVAWDALKDEFILFQNEPLDEGFNLGGKGNASTGLMYSPFRIIGTFKEGAALVRQLKNGWARSG